MPIWLIVLISSATTLAVFFALGWYLTGVDQRRHAQAEIDRRAQRAMAEAHRVVQDTVQQMFDTIRRR